MCKIGWNSDFIVPWVYSRGVFIFRGDKLGIIIKKACVEDARIFAQIISQAWQVAYKNIISEEFMKEKTNVDDRTMLFTKILSENKQSAYIIFDNNRPCGVCTCDISRDEDLTDTFEIIAIYFLPEYWGKGFAKPTIEFVIKEIENKGYNKISLWTLEKNERAKRFYEKCGFICDKNMQCDFDDSLNYSRYIYNLE